MAQEKMKIKLTEADRIKKPKEPRAWLKTIKKYTLGLPLLVMYNQKNLEFF